LENNDVNTRGGGEKFTSGVLPQSPTRSPQTAQASTLPTQQTASTVGTGTETGVGRGQNLRIVETAKAPHAHPGREKDSVLSEEDAKNAEHDHKYLQPVVRESFISCFSFFSTGG